MSKKVGEIDAMDVNTGQKYKLIVYEKAGYTISTDDRDGLPERVSGGRFIKTSTNQVVNSYDGQTFVIEETGHILRKVSQ
ncbi:MAG: hypothetical protein FWC50_01510 [Planctomycetaceae bacterium]|nr:hypothetical protein [Planctomycetaceae bacterium]